MSDMGPMEEAVHKWIVGANFQTNVLADAAVAQDAALAAKDARIAELTAVLEGILRHRTTVADCQCVYHEAARAALAPKEMGR